MKLKILIHTLLFRYYQLILKIELWDEQFDSEDRAYLKAYMKWLWHGSKVKELTTATALTG